MTSKQMAPRPVDFNIPPSAEDRAQWRQQEIDFRRGYSHGFSEAMDVLRGVCDEASWMKLARFFDDQLTPWRYSDASWEIDEPPRAPRLSKGGK